MGVDSYFAGLIEALGEQMGDKELKPAEDGSCTLVFDDLPVSLQYLDKRGEIMFYCVAGSIPADAAAKAGLYSRLLEANYFFRGTGGGVLAADEATGLIGFFRLERAATLDQPAFLLLLESFLNLASHWRGECSRMTVGAPEDATILPSASGERMNWTRI